MKKKENKCHVPLAAKPKQQLPLFITRRALHFINEIPFVFLLVYSTSSLRNSIYCFFLINMNSSLYLYISTPFFLMHILWFYFMYFYKFNIHYVFHLCLRKDMYSVLFMANSSFAHALDFIKCQTETITKLWKKMKRLIKFLL